MSESDVQEIDQEQDLAGLENEDDLALVARMREGREQLVEEIRKVIVGQDSVVEVADCPVQWWPLPGHWCARAGQNTPDQNSC